MLNPLELRATPGLVYSVTMDKVLAGIAPAGWVLVLLAWCAQVSSARRPTDEERIKGRILLSNPRLNVSLMLPGVASSAYIGQRFEHGAVVLEVTLDGTHTFLGREKRSEGLGGIGLIEETGMFSPIGYEDAKPGESFLKLGVGLLIRDHRPYHFYRAYKFSKRYEWDVLIKQNSVTFLQDAQRFKGVSYRYIKRVALHASKPSLRIEHILTNTGEKPIISEQYNHHFLRFDDEPPGPSYALRTSFPLEVTRNAGIRVAGNEFKLSEVIAPGRAVHCYLEGFSRSSLFYSLVVENEKNGLRMTIEGDYGLSRLAFYSDSYAFCPEPFVNINLKPGETQCWTLTYHFSSTPP